MVQEDFERLHKFLLETEATLPTSRSISASMTSSSREDEHGGIPPVAVTSARYASNAHLHRSSRFCCLDNFGLFKISFGLA